MNIGEYWILRVRVKDRRTDIVQITEIKNEFIKYNYLDSIYHYRETCSTFLKIFEPAIEENIQKILNEEDIRWIIE
jgi:hypothetical protein